MQQEQMSCSSCSIHPGKLCRGKNLRLILALHSFFLDSLSETSMPNGSPNSSKFTQEPVVGRGCGFPHFGSLLLWKVLHPQSIPGCWPTQVAPHTFFLITDYIAEPPPVDLCCGQLIPSRYLGYPAKPCSFGISTIISSWKSTRFHLPVVLPRYPHQADHFYSDWYLFCSSIHIANLACPAKQKTSCFVRSFA